MQRPIAKIDNAPSWPGLSRMRALFRNHAFAPHRHDVYALGVTTFGAQMFDYRGVSRASLQGDAFVLHPDERHDGRAGDARGFGYRIAYLDPVLVREAAGTASEPFLSNPVSANARLRTVIADLSDVDEPMTELRLTSIIAALGAALASLADRVEARGKSFDAIAMRRVRDVLLAEADARIAVRTLEAVSGLDRWRLNRQFRAAYGTSPYRFHLLRRLDRARDMLRTATPLAAIAQATGFADQAHLTRHFRRAFGLTPGQWRSFCSL